MANNVNTLTKVTYVDNSTVIGATNLNNIQNAIIELENEVNTYSDITKLTYTNVTSNIKQLKNEDGTENRYLKVPLLVVGGSTAGTYTATLPNGTWLGVSTTSAASNGNYMGLYVIHSRADLSWSHPSVIRELVAPVTSGGTVSIEDGVITIVTTKSNMYYYFMPLQVFGE